ncbi:unnamed protein product [Darwinula stevensoni]|uniref:Caspase-like protein n=1 Tax=Darwinula stevensoni TaxID=69355 RepID=A0A7R9AEI1_9CRUS|nr:unnamed protein product [Darwinula stevensoni]CAG0901617.1 unnamed protein product [Darwinula stevensoni]
MCHDGVLRVRRGKALVFNMRNFAGHRNISERQGSEHDVARLRDVLTSLHLTPIIYEDKTRNQVDTILEEVASEQDLADDDCLVVVYMSHGAENGTLEAFDRALQLQDLWECFIPGRCPSLWGKPKLFFVQACEGSKKMEAAVAPSKKSKGLPTTTSTDIVGDEYTIPSHADFLISKASVPGHVSHRDVISGTWFIQTLCDVLVEHSQMEDLVGMLTLTGARVARHFQTSEGFRQMPSYTSTLRQKVFFTPPQ